MELEDFDANFNAIFEGKLLLFYIQNIYPDKY